MQKTITFALLIFFSGLATGQNKAGWYATTQGSYSFGILQDVFVKEKRRDASYGNIYASAGGGYTGGISAGYGFNPHFAIEIGGLYFGGREQTISEQDYVSDAGVDIFVNATLQNRHWETSLKAVLFPFQGRWKPYLKSGLLLSTGSTTQLTITDDLDYPAYLGGEHSFSYSETDVYARTTIAASTAIGCRLQLSQRWAVFAEAEAVFLEMKRKRHEVKSYMKNDREGLQYYPGPTEVTYYDELTLDEIFNQNEKGFTQKDAYSRLNFTAGLVVFFGKAGTAGQ